MNETNKYRVGRDFFQRYTITKNDGTPVNMAEVLNLTVTVRKLSTGEQTQHIFTSADNTITIQWYSKENTKVGAFAVKIEWDVINSNSITGNIHSIVDFCPAFEIVALSTMETKDGDTIAGTAKEYGQDGASAFEVWKAKYGTPESTEDDYIAYLQKPCVVTSLSYENGLLTFKRGE